MKVKYSRDVDILMVWLSDEPFDYAEEANRVVTHFTKMADRFCWKSKVQKSLSWVL